MQISSEHEALEFLWTCLRDPEFGNDRPLTFKACTLRVRLDPGDGQLDWKGHRAIKLLQHHLNLTYLLAKRGIPAGKLGAFDWERLSATTSVKPGSTTIAVDIAKALAAIQGALPAHWSMRARNTVMAGVLVAIVALPYAGLYTTYRTKVDEVRIAAAAAVQVAEHTNHTNREIAKIQAATQAAMGKSGGGPSPPELALALLARDDPSNVVAFAISDYVPWRPALMDIAPYSGTVQWNDNRPIPERAAKAISKTVRAEAREQRRIAKENGHPGLITTPWVTEVLSTHQAPGAMRLGFAEA